MPLKKHTHGRKVAACETIAEGNTWQVGVKNSELQAGDFDTRLYCYLSIYRQNKSGSWLYDC